MSDAHGERDSQRLFRKYNLRLTVPTSCLHFEGTEETGPVDVPYLKISDFLKVLLKNHSRVLFGGVVGEAAERLLDVFWARFELFQPDHVVFRLPPNERRSVLPLCIHGDKGRGYLKSPVYCFSFETVFGLPEKIRQAGSKSDSAKQKRKQGKQVHGGRLTCTCADRAFDCQIQPIPEEDACSIKRRKLDNGEFVEALQHNARGNTLLTRFLIAAIPQKVFKPNPLVVETLLAALSEDLKGLFESGLSVDGRNYKAVLIGVKGDYEFHMEAAMYERHYARAGHVRDHAMCPECHAGMPNIPYTDVSDSPRWAEPDSLYASQPWQRLPPLNSAPFAGPETNPATLYRRDMFHTIKYGFARDLAASALFWLAHLTYFDFPNMSRSIDERLSRAFNTFKLWCLAEGRVTTLKKFSRQNLHRKKAGNFPWLGGKGADTVLCLMFLDHYLWVCKSEPRHPSHVGLLAAMQQTIRGCLDFIGVMHAHDLFLPPSCAAFMLAAGMTFLRGYAYLAQLSIERGLKYFSLRPKVHYYHHTLRELHQQVSKHHEWVLSPSAWNCESNEDYIGKISRLSRRVSPKICGQRVIDRYLVAAKLIFERAGV